VLWDNTIGGNADDRLNSLQQTSDGGYILAGTSWSNISGDKTENNADTAFSPTSDFWIIKLSPDVGFEELSASETFHLFPNPSTNQLTIDNGELKIERIEIYSALGEKVLQSHISNRTSPISIDISHLPSGMYFASVKTKNGISTAKFVKE
jgi:hypothetical protein